MTSTCMIVRLCLASCHAIHWRRPTRPEPAAAAFRHLKDEIQGIEIVKEELKAVKEELRAVKTNMQINRFEIDRLEQYSRRDSVRVCGIAETDNENTNDIVVRVAKDMGVVISPNDISVSHRV